MKLIVKIDLGKIFEKWLKGIVTIEPEAGQNVGTHSALNEGYATQETPQKTGIPELNYPPESLDYPNGATSTEVSEPRPSVPSGGVDTEGLPWDHRINTSNQSRTAKGVWKRKPGLTDEFVNGVKDELRAVMAVESSSAGSAPAADYTGPTSHMELTNYILQNGIAMEKVDFCAKQVGLPGYSALTARPDLVQAVYEELRK